VIGSDLADTPLAQQLAALRNTSAAAQHNNAQIETDELHTRVKTLIMDLRQAMIDLSAPIIERFAPEITYTETAQMTNEQAAGMRYTMLMRRFEQYRCLAEYILGYKEFKQQLQEDAAYSNVVDTGIKHIWSAASDGAGASGALSDLLINVIHGALRNPALIDISAGELRDFTLAHRATSLNLATYHLSDVNLEGESAEAFLAPRDSGVLELLNEIRQPDKRSRVRYSAIGLMCPALHEFHENKALIRPDKRRTLGYSNYIDHILAIGINEAYARGMFDLQHYRQAAGIR